MGFSFFPPWKITALKDKKGCRITSAFQQILDKSNRKPIIRWVVKGTIDQWNRFYNRSMKSWLQDNACFQHIMKGNLLLLKDLL